MRQFRILEGNSFDYERNAQDSDDDFASLLDSGTPQKPSPGDDLQSILAEVSPSGIQTIDLRSKSSSPLKDIIEQSVPFTPGSIPSSPKLSPDNVNL